MLYYLRRIDYVESIKAILVVDGKIIRVSPLFFPGCCVLQLNGESELSFSSISFGGIMFSSYYTLIGMKYAFKAVACIQPLLADQLRSSHATVGQSNQAKTFHSSPASFQDAQRQRHLLLLRLHPHCPNQPHQTRQREWESLELHTSS